MAVTYREAGVDIEMADAFVERIQAHASRTRRPEVISGVGGFGGLFALPPRKYVEPVLVSGADGVGTKLKVAHALGRHDTIGIDLVAMSVNDILTCGAEPLFFLDYFATSKLLVREAEQIISGVARGCQLAGCALLGGETAEVPDFYQAGEYELAGFCVGVVERSKIIDGKTVVPGDKIIGVASSGVHSNGYSLVRKILRDKDIAFNATVQGVDFKSALLEPTRIYVKEILALLAVVPVKAIAHITGSGLEGNVPRNMPHGTRAVLVASAWERPKVFEVLQALGQVSTQEMYRTFNMGLGLTLIVSAQYAPCALEALHSKGLMAWEVGCVEAGKPSAEAEAIIQW